MRVLFVDDVEQQRELFRDAMSDWNAANQERVFEWHVCGSVDAAKLALGERPFDCALLDLRLPVKDADDKKNQAAGADLARYTVLDIGIPVVIISGNPDDLAEDLKSNTLIKRVSKVDEKPYAKAIGALAQQWEMMAVLRAVRARIRKARGHVFFQRVWPQWKEYKRIESGEQGLHEIVARQFAGHIAEFMGIDGSVGWHPFENYIVPPMHGRPQTGDIFELENSTCWVVLSPQCDMATGTIENVLLVRCSEGGVDQWEEKLKALVDAGGNPSNKLRDYFLNLVNQNREASSHFLPPLRNGQPIKVSFKQMETRPRAHLMANLEHRIATVAPAFLPNLVQRFGAYLSRTGQPNIDVLHFADMAPKPAK